MKASPDPGAAAAPVDPDESALLMGLRAGDESAYESLVRAYSGRLLAVSQRFVRNEEDARDAVQEAFISAFRSIRSFQGQSRVGTWLHRIVVNNSLMKLRSRRRAGEESIEDLLPKFQDDGHRVDHPCGEWAESCDTVLQRKERRDLVRRCIDRLPETYRTALLMRDIEELDTEETSRLLGVSPNAVKIRLHRARQALRELLDPHFRGGGA